MSGAPARHGGTPRSRPAPVRRAVAALVLLALAVRVVTVLATPDYAPVHDAADYDRLACWVAEHGAPADRSPPPPAGPASCAPAAGRHPGRATAYRPPLWPLALGGTYAIADATGIPRWTAGRLVQAAIGTAIVGLIGALALSVGGAEIALVAMALATLFLPLVLDGATLISEPLFVALELGAVLAVLRYRDSRALRWAVAAGVLAGLAALTRLTGLALIPLLAIGANARPHRPAAAAAVVVAAALVIAPWTIRNALVFHAFVPVSTESGQTLLGTYNAEALGTPGCRGCWVNISRYPRYAALTERIHRAGELERDRLSRDLAVDYVRAHFAAVPQVAAHNTVRLLELGGAERTRFGAETIGVPPGAAVVGAVQVWAVAALALLAAAGGALRRAPPWLALLVAALFVATVLVQSETPRFRAPLDPFLLVLAASALCRGAEQLSQRALP
jgi:4-amino-4-deoxy-L-arabinose transferase-like glycosyltransferase